jgi:hypothetical protein
MKPRTRPSGFTRQGIRDLGRTGSPRSATPATPSAPLSPSRIPVLPTTPTPASAPVSDSMREEPFYWRPYEARAPEVAANAKTPQKVIDCLYDRSDELSAVILAAFPGAHLENADDYIKGARTAVTIDKATPHDWYVFLVKKGLAGLSLMFQLCLQIPVNELLMETVLDEADPTWRARLAYRRSKG